ncbi:MAG: SiaB family protein kinase [Desulfobacterales bacterium]|nr:SiaB family protein kinase [Desulfobacterales bacterium]
MVDNLVTLKSAFDREGIILYYNGLISHDLVVEIADIVRHKMQIDEVESSTRLKVFAAVVEQLQNILYYSFEVVVGTGSGNDDKEMRRGVVIVGHEEGHYYVVGGNLIDNSKIDRLRDKLSMLQKMNKHELKKYVKEQRRRTPDRDSRGAGLGIIELARRASTPILFDFTPVRESASFFSLKTVI